MDFPRRIDPLGLDAELDTPPDEELPGYEPQNAPTYDSADFEMPIHSYSLRQTDRKLQQWVPMGPSPMPSYRVARRGFRVFSKKADMYLTCSTLDSPLDHLAAAITFDDDGPLPWRPRAYFSHSESPGNTVKHNMESRNFTDWTMDLSGITFAWRLEGTPVSIVLSEKTSALVIARFTYSRYGTRATKGAEVGELRIFRDRLSVDRDGIEKIIASLMIPIAHFTKMGRQYWNDEPIRAASLTREYVPAHRPSTVSLW